MSDAASGADLLAGQGEQSPAGGQAAGNAPEGQWYGNQELSGYVQNKGWQSADSVIEGYQNLEKILGDKANAMLMPKEGDEQAWGDFYNRMGRPANSSEYKFTEIEGGDGKLTDWFRGVAHQHGLTQTQAAAMFDAWNDFAQSGNDEMAQAQEAQSTKDLSDLKREWGNEYDANIKAGQRAASRFGFTSEEMSGMEQAIGTKAMLERFAQIGRAFGEDQFEAGEGGKSNFGLTPAAAQEQLSNLKMDKNFNDAYLNPEHPGHKEAKAKMQRLFEAAYPGGQA